MVVTFFKDQPYFTKNNLQRKSMVKEYRFSKTSLPFPTFDDNVSPILSHSSSLGLVVLENSSPSLASQQSSTMPNKEELLTRGESLQTKSQVELHVYKRRNHQ